MMVPSKKRVLIVVHSFSIGGTIVSLHSLLSVIDTTRYEIDIFALVHEGVYLDKMPNCTVLPENIWLSHRYKNGGLYKRLFNKGVRVACSIVRRMGLSIEPLMCKLASRHVAFKQYDTIVNFDESIAHVVCHYPAKRRIAWVHCDYERYLSLIKGTEEKVYKAFDTVVCVSEFAKSSFCRCLPQMQDKTVAIHNVINVGLITEKAQEPIDDARFITDGYTIVSAGRLDPVKQFHLIPQLAADIKKQTDKKFVWYIIGGHRGFDTYVDGIKRNIAELGVSDYVILLGEKSNVYPYMAKADLYVSTSLSESFPLVINEAKALGIPVVSNNFGSAAESVEDGVDGCVVCVEDAQFTDRIVRLIEGELVLQNTSESYLGKTNEIIEEINKILSI